MVNTTELEDMLEEHEERISEMKERLEEEKAKEAAKHETAADNEYMARYRDIMDQHRQILAKHQEFMDVHTDLLTDVSGSYDKIVHEFRSGSIQNLEDFDKVLEDISEEKQSESVGYMMKGAGLIGAGFASAAFYSAQFMTNMVDFYAQSPEIYVEKPEAAFFTLGLPLVGLYMFANAYEKSQERQKYKKKKAEVEEELEDIYA